MYYFQCYPQQYNHNWPQINSLSEGVFGMENLPFFSIPFYFPPEDQNQEIKQEISPIPCLNIQEQQVEGLKNSQEAKREAANIMQDHSKQKSEQTTRIKKKKREKDPEFIKRTKKIVKKTSQIPGRNRISNVFRAFLKLISNKIYLESIQQVIKTILEKHQLELSLKSFISWVKEHIPNCSNYVNRPEFQRIYFSDCPYGILFRVLLRRFLRSEGASYITTVNSRKKILAENKVNFLYGMREVEKIVSEENDTIEGQEENE